MRKNLGASEGSSIFIFALVGSSILSYVFSAIMQGRGGSFDGMSITNWIGYALIQLSFLLVIFIYSSVRKYDVRVVSKIRKPMSWKQYLFTLPLAIACMMVFLPLYLLFEKFLAVVGYVGPTVTMPAFSNFGVYALALLVMAALPAVGEEMLMRGTVVPALASRGVKFSILISAMLFSLMHASPYQTVHQFGLGIVLAVVFMLSGSIIPCMLIHFFNNFISVTVSAYMPEVNNIAVTLGNWQYLTGAASVIVGALLLVVLLYWFNRVGKPKSGGFKVVENGIVFDEYTIYATSDKAQKKSNPFRDTFNFVKSLFSKHGWRRVENELRMGVDVPYYGKAQPMTNVWLAIGFTVFYWVLTFILGIV